MALTRKELDRTHCMNPQCDHKSHRSTVVISGMCHIGKPTVATYENGVLTFLCAVCKKLVVEVEVAP